MTTSRTTEDPLLHIVRVSEMAFSPTRASILSAGFDLITPMDFTIDPGARELIDILIKVQLPYGCYGRIASRSGHSLNMGIEVGAGVIDRDYTGNIKVLLYNHGKTRAYFNRGDKIAQLILEKNIIPYVMERVGQGPFQKRGDNGFGSSDKAKVEKQN